MSRTHGRVVRFTVHAPSAAPGMTLPMIRTPAGVVLGAFGTAELCAGVYVAEEAIGALVETPVYGAALEGTERRYALVVDAVC